MIPEAILVAIENTDPARGRVHDLTPPGLSVSGSGLDAGGDRFLDFIERELLPAVDRQFRGGTPRTLIGHSSGAILATYAAATRSTYRTVIAIDAPIGLGDNWLAKKLTARAAAPLAPLRYVSYESRFGWPAEDWQALVAAAPTSWQLRREVLQGEGHETLFMLGAYLGLREVFRDYSRLVAQERPALEILDYYSGVSTALGGALPPPKRLLREVVDDLIAEGRGVGARAAYRLFVESTVHRRMTWRSRRRYWWRRAGRRRARPWRVCLRRRSRRPTRPADSSATGLVITGWCRMRHATNRRPCGSASRTERWSAS
ncbi:MAG: hypothetical protein IPF53_21070 [Blastocatellia bacterium]|nr:hypothetical protein [Blastocatellia bacterium]